MMWECLPKTWRLRLAGISAVCLATVVSISNEATAQQPYVIPSPQPAGQGQYHYQNPQFGQPALQPGRGIQQVNAWQDPTAPMPPAAPPADGEKKDDAPAGEEEKKEEEEKPPEPWTLTELFTDPWGNNPLKEKNIKIGGNLVQSFTFNFNNPSDKFNGPVTWTDRSNEYQLNQLWIYGEKAINTTEQDWDYGGRVDVNYGTSSRLFTETGLEVGHLNSGNALYGLAFPNLYGEIGYKKLKMRVGHFVSPIGYFTVNTVDNFFNTIPYTYQWGEPFTHTGVQFYYQATDNLAISAGITRGWDNFDNSNPNAGFLGTWSYTFQDKSNLTQVIVYSKEPNFNFEFTPRYYQSLVYMKNLTETISSVTQSDFGTQDNATLTGQRANWYGVNQYFYYKQNDYITWGLNFEWWRDEEGYRVAGFLPSNLPSGITGQQRGGLAGQGGFNGNFYQVTFGPKINPFGTPNVFIRPNLRYDWYSGGTGANGFGNTLPYSAGTKGSQGLFVTDLVVLF